MILQQLLGSLPVAKFLEEYYLKLPFACPGGCLTLAPLGSWERVESLLVQPGVDALVGREGQPWPGRLPPTPAEARQLLSEGYTLGIRRAQRHDPDLAELARDFAETFHAPIDVHVYCTPAGQPGFGWHYDAEEVFLLQTQGRKEWGLRKNTVNPWPLVEALPADMRHEREIMPLLRCTLAAGDWLYLPGGYWHRSQAGEESISLSVGVAAPTALDVYDFLRQRLLTSLRWRQRLPPAAAFAGPEDLRGRYRDLFADLGRDLAELLASDDTLRAFLAHKGDPS